MANRVFKRDARLGLGCLVWLFLVGAGVWLKLILANRLRETLQHTLLYEREFSLEYNWNVSRGLHIWSDFDSCAFGSPPPPTSKHSRELEEMLTPTATPTAAPTVAKSPFPPPPLPASDWNEVYCGFGAKIVINATLDVIENPVGPLYFVVMLSHDWKRWTQMSQIDVADALITKTIDMNGTRHIGTVEVSLCVQQPDWAYVVGCVREGYDSGKFKAEYFAPPFSECVAIDTLCGPTCGAPPPLSE